MLMFIKCAQDSKNEECEKENDKACAAHVVPAAISA